jgi:putative peptidoglycan lipid II flippase
LEFNAKRYGHFKKIFSDSFHQILFLILPAAAIIAILRIPLVRLVFGAREFSWDLTVLTGRTLIAFSIGIPALALSLLLTRGFHAVKDSKTPLIVSGSTISLNIALSLFFVHVLGQSIVYLALIYSSTAILNAIVLFYVLDKKIGFDKKALFVPAVKMLSITTVTAICLYIPMKLLDQLVFDTTRTIGLIALTGSAVLAGLIVYIGLSYIFRIKEVIIFRDLGKKVIAFPQRFTKPAPTSIEAQQPNP